MLLKKILKIEGINVNGITLPTEDQNKEKFITEFLAIFNEPAVTKNAGLIIEKNLDGFTEELLKIADFKEKHTELFANASPEVTKKTVDAINSEEQEQAPAKANATKIALESKNTAVLEKVLETQDISNKITIEKATKLSNEVAKKLSDLAAQQEENHKKTNAKALIARGIEKENQAIIENLTAEAIKTLEPEKIKTLGTEANLKILDKNIASDLNTSLIPKVKSLARKIAYTDTPEKIAKSVVLSEDNNLSKQLNKTLTEAKDSVITKEDLAKIIALSSTESTLLPFADRKTLVREEITIENQFKMSSIKLGLVNATQNFVNNVDDTKKLKTALQTASSLIGSAKNGEGKDINKQVTAKDITDSAVDFNRDRLKLLGFYRELDGNNAYKSYKPDKNGESAIKEFKKLEIIDKLYKGKGSTFSGKEEDRWKVKLAFIEFMGYKTPEELSFLRIVDKDKDKDAKSKQDKIEVILKQIKTNFGWTLGTGYSKTVNKPMQLEYKEPDKNNEIFKNFVQQSIDFLKIAEKAEKAEEAEKAVRVNQGQDVPKKTLKGSLEFKKAKFDELAKQK